MAYENCFCVEVDVERYAGTAFTTTSRPPAADIELFAEETAAYLVGICTIAGKVITPAGGASDLDTSTDVGKALEDLLRNANAIGAAAKAKRAAFLGIAPNDSPVPEILDGLFLNLAGGYDPITRKKVEGVIPMLIRSAFLAPGTSYAKTHISAGEVAAYQAPSGLEESLPFDDLNEHWQ